MITKELIARINELSRKKRSSGLSEDERIEQQALRREYLAGIREQVRNMLEQVEIIDTPLEQESTMHVKEVAFSLRPSHKLIDRSLSSAIITARESRHHKGPGICRGPFVVFISHLSRCKNPLSLCNVHAIPTETAVRIFL